MVTSILGVINRLLPLATPGTPLIQDLLHLVAICILLYFAPQVQEKIQRRKHGVVEPTHDHEDVDPSVMDAQREDAEVPAEDDEREVDVVEQVDGNDGDVNPAPLVPDQGALGPAHQVNVPLERTVGTKKAKALAKKDRRRHYHEFMRWQGEAQRSRDAEGEAEREAALAVERDRRKAAEAAFEAKKVKGREERRQREEHERKEDLRRRVLTVHLVKHELDASKTCDLFKIAEQVGDDVEEEWIEQILKASGLIGRKGDTLTMITETASAVRVTADDMAQLYAAAVENKMGGKDGKIENEDLGAVLESMLRG